MSKVSNELPEHAADLYTVPYGTTEPKVHESLLIGQLPLKQRCPTKTSEKFLLPRIHAAACAYYPFIPNTASQIHGAKSKNNVSVSI